MANRLEEVKEFYASGSVAGVSLISEELKLGDLLTADGKGKWALEQFENGAKTLNILKFLVSLERGGVELPEIQPVETYVERLLEASAKVRADLESTFGVQVRRSEQTYLDLLAAEDDVMLWQAALGSETPPPEAEALKEWKTNVKKRDEAKVKVELMYSKWQLVHTALQKDRQRVEALTEVAMQKAEKQRAEDIDAVNRAKRALDMLKAHLQGLMTKVPDITSVVKKMGPDFVDPYTTGNLRQVYSNLLERYRNSDEMGVTTTLIGGMRLSQGIKQPLETFVRKVEEFHQAMLFLGVTELSIGDVAAIVALAGMHEVHKVAFLESETIMALTVKNLEGGEEGTAGGSDGTVLSRRGDKRSLLEKVLEFSRTSETKKLLVGNMSSGTASSAEKDSTNKEAADRIKREREAQRVMANGVKYTPEERARNGPCHRFRDGRECRFGEFCKFAHGGEVGAKKPVACADQFKAKPGSAAAALFGKSRDVREIDSDED